MTRRLLPFGFSLLASIALTPAHAQTLSCGPLLDGAINAPIPESLIRGNSVYYFPEGEASLEMLTNHVASVAIEWMSGVYVGLSDNVGRCASVGCDAFVYVTSHGFGAISSPFRIDSTSVLDVSDYRAGVPDQYLFPKIFYENRIGPQGQVFAYIYVPPKRIRLIWAGPDVEVVRSETWFSRDERSITIPLYMIEELRVDNPRGCNPTIFD